MNSIEVFKDNQKQTIKDKLTYVEDNLNELYRAVEENMALDDETSESYLKQISDMGNVIKDTYTDIY
ncbi:hypothetical protein ACU3L3_07505 [Priestia endophytica]